jgi:hypothetical protein
MKNLSQGEKVYLAICLGWAFLHLVFLCIGWGYYSSVFFKEEFWPFGNKYRCGDCIIRSIYDVSEFLVYVGTPVVAFLIYKLVHNKK